MVTSVSWPTAEMMGVRHSKMARATISSLNAQRIDTVYQIDDNGKVNKLSEKKYQPKDYSMTILETADIWNGNETPLQ